MCTCFRTHLGEITLIAGLWNLNERARLRSRVVSTHVHSEFAPGDLTNNVALLVRLNNKTQLISCLHVIFRRSVRDPLVRALSH